MGNFENLIEQILLGGADANIGFDDLRNPMLRLGFAEGN